MSAGTRTRQDVYAVIVLALTNVLKVNEEVIQPGSFLTEDLGAESIDFLDIQFHIENALDIQIGHDNLYLAGYRKVTVDSLVDTVLGLVNQDE